MEFQQTIADVVRISGIGGHSGIAVNMEICPAEPDFGIAFQRTDLNGDNIIPAKFDKVIDTQLCTVLANDSGARVATIEHLMSALWGCGIDNALIKINAEEVPILDGSSQIFTQIISEAGVRTQDKGRKFIKIISAVEVEHNGKVIGIEPCEDFEIDFTIEFDSKVIGKQSFQFNEQSNNFNAEISKARTFGFMKDLLPLQKMGLAKGFDGTNAIGIGEEGVINPEGLRYNDEFVRHKVLDCLGDLYLAGARIKGHVNAFKAGHDLNNRLLRLIFSEASNYEIVNCATA